MGKSTLCEVFLHELRTQDRATVLYGRCYVRDNSPFKGSIRSSAILAAESTSAVAETIRRSQCSKDDRLEGL